MNHSDPQLIDTPTNAASIKGPATTDGPQATYPAPVVADTEGDGCSRTLKMTM